MDTILLERCELSERQGQLAFIPWREYSLTPVNSSYAPQKNFENICRELFICSTAFLLLDAWRPHVTRHDKDVNRAKSDSVCEKLMHCQGFSEYKLFAGKANCAMFALTDIPHTDFV